MVEVNIGYCYYISTICGESDEDYKLVGGWVVILLVLSYYYKRMLAVWPTNKRRNKDITIIIINTRSKHSRSQFV